LLDQESFILDSRIKLMIKTKEDILKALNDEKTKSTTQTVIEK
jgi:hypothetical protein